MKSLRQTAFPALREKSTQILQWKLLKGTIIFCLFDESPFSNIWTLWYVTMECIKLNYSNCVNMWKRSEASKLLFQYILVLNLVKQFFPVSIVKILKRPEAVLQRCSLLNSHFGTGVPLKVCCIFSDHFFFRRPLEGCSQKSQSFSTSLRILSRKTKLLKKIV